MKRLFWNIVLLPMLPLIWHAERRAAKGYSGGCMSCGMASYRESPCYQRAKWMRQKMAGN